MAKGRDRPPLTKRSIRVARRFGVLPFSIDRVGLEILREFVKSPMGSEVELKGFLIHRDGSTLLRVVPSAREYEILLRGVDPRLANALRGEPVHIVGVRENSRIVRVKRLRLTNFVEEPPPMGFREFVDRLLDGVDLSTPRELAALTIVSSPRPSSRMCGGLWQATLGRGRSALFSALSSASIPIPRIWRFSRRSEPPSRERVRYVEVSLDIEAERDEAVMSIDHDYPVIVLNASRRDRGVDLDLMDYTLYTKGFRPRLADPSKAMSVLAECSEWIRTWVERSGIPQHLLATALLNPDYLGKPMSILRLALALARARWVSDPLPLVEEARNLIKRAVDEALTVLSEKPHRVARLRDLEVTVLRAVERLDRGEGARLEDIVEELRVRGMGARIVEQILESLRRRGFVYCPRPGVYRVV